MQYSSGTRGFLEWTRDKLPWVYEEYSKRDVSGGDGLQGFEYEQAGSHYIEGGTLGLSGLGDLATDTGVTTYFGTDPSSAGSVAASSPPADPASAAPAAATSSTQSNIFAQLATAVGGFMLTKQQLDTQNKIVSVQLDRAQRGLPPLNINTLQAGLPQPTVRVGLAADTGKLVMYAALGLGALFLLPQLLKAARR